MAAKRLTQLFCMGLFAVLAQPVWAQVPPRPGQQPPPHAFRDCRDRAPGDKVWHRMPEGEVVATCVDTPWGLAARPNRPAEPPQHALDDCRGKQAGQVVRHWTPEGTVNATCVETPRGLAARPNQPLGGGVIAAAPPPAAAPLPAPVQQKAQPGEAPAVSILPIPVTSAQAIDVSGKVSSKGRITGLQVDGTDVPMQSDGSFSIRRGIPLGDSEIKLAATDEWGQTSESRVPVTRVTASTETVMAPLVPNRAHGKARPNAIALIIGVEQYKSVPPAEFAENDARVFYDYAINALGVPPSRVKLLTGTNAQKVDVEAAVLTWLKPQVVKGQSDVFVFFSGHGLASDDGRDLYLLPQDGNRALLDRSALRRKELIDMIVDSGANSATLFLDTCYSGGTRGKETLLVAARPILVSGKDHDIPANVTILAAAGNDQLSSSLAQAKHGLFSYFLMKGLEGAAAGSDRTITAATLETYLAERVPSEAAKLGRSQNPQLMGDGGRVMSAW